MPLRFLPAVALVSVLVVACEPATGADPVPLEDFGPRVARAYCGRVFACCSAEELEAEAPGYTDEAGCVGLTGSLVTGFFTSPVQLSVNAGRAAWRPIEATTCLYAIDHAPCSELDTLDIQTVLDLTGCETIVEPFVAEDDPCELDVDCVTTYCEEAGAPSGTCRPLPGEGANCPDFQCDDGLSCQWGQCQQQRTAGAICNADSQCLSGTCHPDDQVCTEPVLACGAS